MGLVKRNRAWRMSLMYQGLQVRRSTSTTDKRLAESILAKVKVQIAEGSVFRNSGRAGTHVQRDDGSVSHGTGSLEGS